jgi:hypothetical protein
VGYTLGHSHVWGILRLSGAFTTGPSWTVSRSRRSRRPTVQGSGSRWAPVRGTQWSVTALPDPSCVHCTLVFVGVLCLV